VDRLNYQQTTVGAGAVSPKRDADTSFGGEITARAKFSGVRFSRRIGTGIQLQPGDRQRRRPATARTPSKLPPPIIFPAPISTASFPRRGYQGRSMAPARSSTPPEPGAITTVVQTRRHHRIAQGGRGHLRLPRRPYLELTDHGEFLRLVSAGALVTVVRDEVNWSEPSR